MALQGSLSDFALPDVLALLSSTKKSGELHIRGFGGEGRVWLDRGQVVAAEAGWATEPVDVLFELLRNDDGHFRFDTEVNAPSPGTPQPLEPLLEEAAGRLSEWKVIEAVVPSLATRVRLVEEAPASPVVIEGEQWKVLVAVANGGTVGTAASLLGFGEFGACRAVKGLVDAGLVAVVRDDEPVESDTSERRAVDLDSLVEIPNRRRRASRVEAAEEPPAVESDLSPTKRLSAAAARKAEAEAEQVGALARQLASITAPEPADASPAAPGEGSEAVAVAADPALGAVTEEEAAAIKDAGLIDENGEPINRSLLLKFLSSVRS